MGQSPDRLRDVSPACQPPKASCAAYLRRLQYQLSLDVRFYTVRFQIGFCFGDFCFRLWAGRFFDFVFASSLSLGKVTYSAANVLFLLGMFLFLCTRKHVCKEGYGVENRFLKDLKNL